MTPRFASGCDYELSNLSQGLERAYETALNEYIEARSSEWFFICSDVAARKKVEMERTRCEPCVHFRQHVGCTPCQSGAVILST
jgi:hypothetical protein